jgi:hypothetical protein
MTKQVPDIDHLVTEAAEYTKEATDVLELAWSLQRDNRAKEQKCASLAPQTVALLTSLTRNNGQPFCPAGMEKKASAHLSSHPETIQLLNAVLNEYGNLKAAFDRQTPPIGSAGRTTKTASGRKTVNFDGPESNAMETFNRLLLDS